jgi:hypothetical protein
MKAAELMIGDWVHLDGVQVDDDGKNPVYQLLARRVAGLRKGVVTLEDGTEIYPGLCMAVPMTKELLESNGFVLRDGCSSAWDLHMDNGYSVHIDGTHDCPIGQIVTINEPSHYGYGCGFHRVIDEKRVRGVHQLQHLLRLFGIEKEFIL